MSRLAAGAVPMFLLAVPVLDAHAQVAYQSVDTIRVDSIVRERPVSTLSELLNARIPGLHVTQNEALIGGDVAVRIRAPNSVTLGNEPLILVDGARYVTATGSTPNSIGAANAGAMNPLNDLDPNDVELIEVLKGPAAAALYGAGAGNGVILITTKQGHAGRRRWNVHARQRTTSLPALPALNSYTAWGHSPFGGGGPTQCTLTNSTCTLDSLTIGVSSLDALRATSNIRSWTYGGNVAGGNETTRYYLGANLDEANGTLTTSPVLGGGRVSDQDLTRVNLRANLAAKLGRRAEVRFNSSYLHGSIDNATPLRTTWDERARRFVGSIDGRFQATPWLAAHATLGHDRGRRIRTAILWGTGTLIPDPFASSYDSLAQRATRANLAATATARKGRVVAHSTIGGDYTRLTTDLRSIVGQGLPPNSTSPTDAVSITSTDVAGKSDVRSVYLNESLSLNDRLFIAGGLRAERAKAHNYEFDTEVYPHVSAGWLASGEPWMPKLPGVDRLTFRYGFGVAGQYTDGLLNTGVILFSGSAVPSPQTFLPERVSEHEFGLDLNGLGHRVRMGLTRYSRRTDDQFIQSQAPISINGSSGFSNAGGLSQHGFEADIAAHLLKSRSLDWSVAWQFASTTTKVDEDLNASGLFDAPENGYVASYPVGALFRSTHNLSYADANGNGVLEPSEIILTTESQYLGQRTPRRWQALGTSVGLFDRRLRLSALVERRSGHMQVNTLATEECEQHSCAAAVDPSTPLDEQAEAIAIQNSDYFLVQSGAFTRFRELAATVELPQSFARALRGRALTLTVAGRNLGLWTDANTPDPETESQVPAGRAWMLRLDLDL